MSNSEFNIIFNKRKIKDCCLFVSDGDHQPPPKTAQGVPFVTISNITQYNQLNFDDVMYVSHEYYESIPEKSKAQKDDILYSVVGSFGKPVYIDQNMEFVFQRHIAILRPDKTVVLPRFLYYTLMSPNFYAMADNLAIGAAQRTLSLESLRNIEIDVPTIEEQQKIVDIIEPIERKILSNTKINDYLTYQSSMVA